MKFSAQQKTYLTREEIISKHQNHEFKYQRTCQYQLIHENWYHQK